MIKFTRIKGYSNWVKPIYKNIIFIKFALDHIIRHDWLLTVSTYTQLTFLGMWVSTFMIPLLLRVCASRKWRNQVNFITRHEYHHENKSLTFWNFRLRPEQTRWHSNFLTPYFMNLGLGTRLERVRDKSFLPTMTLYGIQPSGEHRKTSLELLGQLHLSLINYDEENKEYSIDKLHKTTTYVTYHINITLAHDIWFDCSTTPFPHLTYITQGTVWHFFYFTSLEMHEKLCPEMIDQQVRPPNTALPTTSASFVISFARIRNSIDFIPGFNTKKLPGSWTRNTTHCSNRPVYNNFRGLEPLTDF